MCVCDFLFIVDQQYIEDGQLTTTMIQYACAGRCMCSAIVGPAAVPEQSKIHYAYEAPGMTQAPSHTRYLVTTFILSTKFEIAMSVWTLCGRTLINEIRWLHSEGSDPELPLSKGYHDKECRAHGLCRNSTPRLSNLVLSVS